MTEKDENNWKDILKSPFPNTNFPNPNRPTIKGSGRGGLFKFNELDKISPQVTKEVNAAYEKEIEKQIKSSIREAKKRLKSEGKEFSQRLEDYITKRVRKVLTAQKESNLYATAYGSYASPMNRKNPPKWFGGGFKKLGYNPKEESEMEAVLRRVSGLGNRYFEDWQSAKEKETKQLQDRLNTLRDLKAKATLENDTKRLKTIEQNIKNVEEKAAERNIMLKSWFNLIKAFPPIIHQGGKVFKLRSQNQSMGLYVSSDGEELALNKNEANRLKPSEGLGNLLGERVITLDDDEMGTSYQEQKAEGAFSTGNSAVSSLYNVSYSNRKKKRSEENDN